MPDFHSVCADIPQSMEEFERQIDMCMQTGKDLNVNYEAIFRATKEFFEKNKEWVYKAAEKMGKPVLLELLPRRKHYWIAKMDFAAIDYLGRPIENPTIQIDVESAERFDITYKNKKDEKEYPIIIHCSPTGSIERVIGSLLEKTAIEENEKPPMLPVWLSPTQIRIIPIAKRHLEKSMKLVNMLKKNNIRVDVDDRVKETPGKRIRIAAKEWIPYIILIGDKEEDSDYFTVNIRETNKQSKMDNEELVAKIKSEMEGMPFRKLPLPLELSKRVNF
jgi:Threonyl-tRNA synthetase